MTRHQRLRKIIRLEFLVHAQRIRMIDHSKAWGELQRLRREFKRIHG